MGETTPNRTARRAYLAHRYGQETFFGRWGVWLALGAGFLVAVMFVLSGFIKGGLVSGPERAWLELGMLGGVVLVVAGCFSTPLVAWYGAPRVNLLEALGLMIQAGLVSFLALELLASQVDIPWPALILLQALYVWFGALGMQAARRSNVQSAFGRFCVAPIFFFLFASMVGLLTLVSMFYLGQYVCVALMVSLVLLAMNGFFAADCLPARPRRRHGRRGAPTPRNHVRRDPPEPDPPGARSPSRGRRMRPSLIPPPFRPRGGAFYRKF